MAYSVLIVDDSLTVRMDLKKAFDAGGFRTVLCATGAEARSALADEPVDVAILDVLLPDANGVSLIREVRADPSRQDAVVIMLSGEDEVADRVRALRAGADEYVGKPYDPGYVVARAREVLRSRLSSGRENIGVLVIDDSLTFREELRRVLEAEGYPVITAANGEEGLRLAADRRPTAIIVDGVLPGIDGATVIRQVRLDPALRDTPCLLLTASDDYGTELTVIEAGADAFVRKQDDLSVVLAMLAAVLRHGADTLPIQPAGSVHGPTKVLVVDGDRGRLRAVADALRAENHDVVSTEQLGDAIMLLSTQPVDCVVLDLDIVGPNHRNVIRRIRAVPAVPDVPIVMTGVRTDRDVVLSCLTAGADGYVCRSDGLDTLSAHVRGQIRRKQRQDEGRRIREELLRGDLQAAEARAARDLAETRAALVEELEWRNRELDAFTGAVSHDLRGPLQVLTTFSQDLLEDEYDSLSEAGRHRLRRINAAVHRMSELVDSLLLLSRMNRVDLNRQPTDLSAMACEVVDELRRREPDRRVEVSVADGLVVDGDPGLLRAVLENLLGNAWKFTGRVEHPTIEVGCASLRGVATDSTCGAELSVFVRDNGAGFPATEAHRLFHPFNRLHSQEDFPGTGIGLVTVRRIIERHGGRIWAESERGHGAVFTFTLPAAGGPPPRPG